jgi:hypothetical protein
MIPSAKIVKANRLPPFEQRQPPTAPGETIVGAATHRSPSLTIPTGLTPG